MKRYDDVDPNRDVSIISMSINNGLLTQLFLTSLSKTPRIGDPAPPQKLCPEAFPIKASGNSEVEGRRQPQVRNHRCEISGWSAKRLKDMVARDGVEPPTPAFSGLRSTT